MRRRVIAFLVVLGVLGIGAFGLLRNRNLPLVLTIHVKSEPPVHLFTNATPDVLRRGMPNFYQIQPLDLKSMTDITEADVEHLRSAVAGKSLFAAKCSSIEFIDEKEAIVITKNLLGMEEHFLFEKSKSRWELIHKRSGRE